MRTFFFLTIAILFSPHLFAQNNLNEPPAPVDPKSIDISKRTIFKVVEQMPEYPGGEQALYKYLSETISYPDTATQKGIEGLVKVKFVVDEYGSIDDVKTTNIPFGYGLEEEAMRVIKMMPPWKPGKNDGKPVKVYFQIPIRFVLPKEEDSFKTK
jgi:TonB family protein